MVTANILGVVQKMDFKTKSIRNYILFEVDGKKLNAEVEDIDELSSLIDAAMGGSLSSTTDEEPAASVAEPHLPDELAPGDDDVVEWRNLPPADFPLEYQLAFEAMAVPAVLPKSNLVELLTSIKESFTQADWDDVFAVSKAKSAQAQIEVAATEPPPQLSVAMPAPPQPQAAAPPPVGVITWLGQNVLAAPTTRARTVPKDEFGYPIVSASDVDPGEVLGGSDVTDEDGVGQI